MIPYFIGCLIKIAKKHASINECLPINKCKTYIHPHKIPNKLLLLYQLFDLKKMALSELGEYGLEEIKTVTIALPQKNS